ncbi:MAG: dGTP triphosphohydrolase, partial [Verrucomicrobiota bacterium]
MALQSRTQWEQHENRLLAPYAQLSSQSEGRYHPESVHTFRSEYQRDRDRILHSTAFRRLEYKTQVVLNGTGDHFRTRLTHTIEVAAIARTICRTLSLNEDLGEAIALAHDLGHAPFGHPGEHTLNSLMQDHGGFEHNQQSLRVVEELEMKYPEFNGLNLSWEVRDGLRKKYKDREEKDLQPSMEAQVADLADEIAYCCHDLDDSIENKLILLEDLNEIQLWKELNDSLCRDYSRLDATRRRRFLIRCMIDHLVEDLCQNSSANLHQAKVTSALQARDQPKRLISFSLETRSKVQNLRDFLLERFYYHPDVCSVNKRA